MNLNEDMKKAIAGYSYKDLLTIWRFARVGDPRLQGEYGDYFQKIMLEKKETLSPQELVIISKEVGCE